MGREWIRSTVGKLTNKPKAKKEDAGYELLMDIIDRKVFDVENSRVTEGEFTQLSSWMVKEYNNATMTNLGGRLVKEDPMLMVEVIAGEPVFIEVHDYKVRYRVNVYLETGEVEIEVLEPVKDKELRYTKTAVPVLTL